MNWAAIIWLVLMVIFIWIEASSVAMISLWFAAGALTALTASLLGAEVWLQVVLFAVVSGILLWALRPLVKKFFTPKLTRTNVDSVIGTTGLVMETIENVKSQGRVKLGTMEWSARSVTGELIGTGTLVRAERIEGVKVFVLPVKKQEN